MNNVELFAAPGVLRSVSGAARYRAHRVADLGSVARLGEAGFEESWGRAEVAEVCHFHGESSLHRPVTRARCMYTARALHVWFSVRDRYVKAVHTEYQSRVSRDSCVEFFVSPAGVRGYFNFEVNCGGTLLVYYIADSARGENGRLFRDYVDLPAELGRMIGVEHSLPRRVDPEIEVETSWDVTLRIPLEVLEPYCGALKMDVGSSWRVNFFKCADGTSHPHWASWSDIGLALRFHQPERFGFLDFVE